MTTYYIAVNEDSIWHNAIFCKRDKAVYYYDVDGMCWYPHEDSKFSFITFPVGVKVKRISKKRAYTELI